MDNNRVTVADGWTVEAQSEDIMCLVEEGVFSLPIDRHNNPMLFAFLQALHSERFEIQ